MNNLIDYSHIISKYVMTIDFPNENYNIECKCSKFLYCYQFKNLNECKYYNFIVDNIPLFKIFLEPNIKKCFKLPSKWENSNMTTNDFFKIIIYLINFKDESVDYLLDKKNIRCVIVLSLYIIIINNHDIVKNILNICKPLIVNMMNKLKNDYLSNENNIIKLKTMFEKYFIDSPSDCINIMNTWIILMEECVM